MFRLPPMMQSMLREDDTSSIADLAARADALMDAEAAKDNTVAAGVEESTVAAARAAPPFCFPQEEARLEQQEEEAGNQ